MEEEAGQREPATAKRLPDTEPERCVQLRWSGTSSSRKDKKLRFTALLHHIYNLETLGMAYFWMKKEAAPGVDGETWRHYGEETERNLQDLRQAEARSVPSEAGA